MPPRLSPFAPELLPTNLRLDANETMVLSRSLEESAVRVVEHIYPQLKIRELAPPFDGIDAGADTYTWHRVIKTGSAAIVTNYGDDIPSVGQHIEEETGFIRTIATSFEYSNQDLRRAAMAARKGLQPSLPTSPPQLADEFLERKVDEIGALGDTSHNLPGLLRDGSVDINAATGTWAGGGATAAQVVSDIRTGINEINVSSEGAYEATHVVMPIEDARYVATTPLLGTGDNRITIWQEIVQSEREARGGNASLTLVGYNRCVGAGAGSVDRCMIYQRTPDVLGLVNPMGTTFSPPQAQGVHWSTPAEQRVGGVRIFKPLACKYIDGI